MNNKIPLISLRIIIMFSIVMAMSLLPEAYPNLFGDWKCQGSSYGKFVPETQREYSHFDLIGCDYAGYDSHNPTIHWGYRHWIYFLMGLSLFVVQVKDLVDFINKK